MWVFRQKDWYLIMGEEVKIFSQNSQGLANPQKRRGLFRHRRCKKYNIICLQDIHIQESLVPFVKAEWGFDAYFNTFSNNSRGVMVLLNNNFEHTVERVQTDQNGNYIILDIAIQGKRITLANLYGPNDDKPQFFNNIREKCMVYDNDLTIYCGDWNLVIDPDIDTVNYLHVNNPRSRQTVLKFLDEDNFIDVWRVYHEQEKGFTWSRRNPVRKQARLDFFLVSEALFPYVTDASITTGFKSDHLGILLKFKINDNESGRGYWKFNNTLLKDKDYVRIVKDTIKEVKNTYMLRSNEENDEEDFSVPAELVQLNINDQLFF